MVWVADWSLAGQPRRCFICWLHQRHSHGDPSRVLRYIPSPAEQEVMGQEKLEAGECLAPSSSINDKQVLNAQVSDMKKEIIVLAGT